MLLVYNFYSSLATVGYLTRICKNTLKFIANEILFIMKPISILVLFICCSISLKGQKVPDNFKLQKIIQAKDLIAANPNGLLVTGDLKHLIISYDSKPTHLHIYETKNWKRVNAIEIPNYFYLGQSKTDCEMPYLLYGDYGNVKAKFYSINIISGDRTKIKTKEIPKQTCGYPFSGKSKLGMQQFRVKNELIFNINYPKRTISVYTKKVTRT